MRDASDILPGTNPQFNPVLVYASGIFTKAQNNPLRMFYLGSFDLNYVEPLFLDEESIYYKGYTFQQLLHVVLYYFVGKLVYLHISLSIYGSKKTNFREVI